MNNAEQDSLVRVSPPLVVGTYEESEKTAINFIKAFYLQFV